MGVIAQDVEAVILEVVTEREDGIKTVNYQTIVALLIEVIKDHQQQISQLRSCINK